MINTPASGTDGSPTLAKVLSFASAGGSQKSQGYASIDHAQTNGVQNDESVEDKGEGTETEQDTIIEQEGDLEGTILSETDRMLHEVYGDYVHQNSGQQLNGGVKDN